MKIFLVALVVSRGCLCGGLSQPEETATFEKVYISSNSKKDSYSKVVKFSCYLADLIRKLYNSLTTTQADIAEITIVSEGLFKDNCEMWITVPFKLDAKMIDPKETKGKLDFTFQGLLQALIKIGKVFPFEVSSN